MKLEFIKMGINGEGIGYDKSIPVFCDGVLPQEIAEIEIIKEFKHYKKAKLIKIIKASPFRTNSPCNSNCLACPLLILDEHKQSEYKVDLLKQSLWKYARIKSSYVRKMHSSNSLHYRNQCKLPIQEKEGKLVSGLYATGSNHLTVIDDCLIHHQEVEDIRKKILSILNDFDYPAYHKQTKTGLRYLIIRSIDQTSQVTLVTGKDKIPSKLIQAIQEAKICDSLFQSVNTKKDTSELFGQEVKLLFGQKEMQIQLEDIPLFLSPRSFFQLNTEQAKKMYQMVVSKIDPCDYLVEAYCGIGAMSLLAKDKAKKIVGIESIPEAVANANASAKLLSAKHISFLCQDAADGLYKAARLQPIDTLLVDPPRSGLSQSMLDAILKIQPKKLLYVSCNPSTLAKNLKQLKQAYNILSIIPFDFFPNTALVEALCILERKS